MKCISEESFRKENLFGLGQENRAFAQYFTGNSYLNPLTVPGEESSNEWLEPVDDESYETLP